MLTVSAPGPGGPEPDPHVPLAEVAGHGVAAAERALAHAAPGHFSRAALDEFRQRVAAFAEDLAREAVRVAGRHQADVVSQAYVRQAASYLAVRTRDRKLSIVGSLGAVLLGVALPPLFEIPWAPAISATRILVAALFGMAGSLLLTIRHVKQ